MLTLISFNLLQTLTEAQSTMVGLPPPFGALLSLTFPSFSNHSRHPHLVQPYRHGRIPLGDSQHPNRQDRSR